MNDENEPMDPEGTEEEIPVGEPVNGSLIDCPDCGYKISSRVETCPNCGEPIVPEARSSSGQPPDESSGRSNGSGFLTGFGLILGSIVVFAGIFSYLSGNGSEKQTDSPTGGNVRGVKYRVTADGSVSVTFRDKDGEMAQRQNVSTPWTYPDGSEEETFLPDEGQFLQLTAQKIRWREEGRITAQIIIDGDVWKEANCSGAYCMVHESGAFPAANE